MKKTLCVIIVCLCAWSMAYSQTAPRVLISSITPSVTTGQDYTPWLNDDTTNLVADNWSTANMQYIDVKLKLQSRTNVTQLSLYDYTGIFTSTPVTIYAVTGSARTLIATFTGPNYMQWDNFILTTPVLADTIVIHKYGNCIPEKIKIYGNPTALSTPITGYMQVCPGGTTSLGNANWGGVWSSSNIAIASVNAGTGVVSGVSAGTVTISYTITGLLATTSLTVNPSANAGSITGAAGLCTVSSVALSDAVSGGTWTSSVPGVATVSSSGVVTGVSAGLATISYSVANGCGTTAATKVVTVNSAPTAGVISGTSAICARGTSTLTDAVTGGTWSSSATGVATISTTGVVTGVSAGTSTISYTVAGLCGTAFASKAVTVSSSPVAGSITGTTTVSTGSSTTLSDAVTGGVWSSSTPTVATVSGTGVVTGMAAGTTTISYSVPSTCGSAIATAVVTVSPSTGLSTPITGYTQACTGSTTSLGNATWGGLWTSGNTSIATVNSSTGIVTGVTAGVVTISYTISGLLATTAVTVNPSANAGTVAGTSAICSGTTTTLTDAVTGGTWNSSATGVATVNTSGVVTGVSAGTATISYSVSNSCGATAATKVVTVGSTTGAGAITGTPAVTVGGTTVLSDAVAGGTWTSSAPGIATVGTNGTVAGMSAGAATISYDVSGSCGTGTATTAVTVNSITVGTGVIGSPVLGQIPIDSNRWYQLDNCSNGLGGLFDGVLSTNVQTGWGKILSNYSAYYPVLPGEQINIDSVRFYSGTGSITATPFTLYYIDSSWNQVLLGTFVGGIYDSWVGPNPSSPGTFNLPVPVNNIKYLVINSYGGFPNEMQLYGSYIAPSTLPAAPVKTITLSQEFGVNGFEWNFEDPSNPLVIDTTRIVPAKSFSGLRHYLDWQKLEPTAGGYTFNPSHSGGWNYDTMYARCKADGIEVLADLKTLPDWLVSTYPTAMQNSQNVPIAYDSDMSNPRSYMLQAKVAFQFAARYGNNPSVSSSLLSVDASTRWTGDPANTVKKGLNLVKYIECDNERDKWWLGIQAYQTGCQYAANLSAFYDGNKNTMGPGVGVKNADPSMQVVMCGVALPNTDYFRGMIDWCKQHRGYNPDGSVNLCWDVINYHVYSDNGGSSQGAGTMGASPEAGHLDSIAAKFVSAAHAYAHDMPVWVTETGYDVNQGSTTRAYPIGSKSALQTQADWTLRTSLLHARMGIERTFFYEMYDDDSTNATKFSSSGLINSNKSRRPAADYMVQANKLMGNYVYQETISTNPLVDRYALGGNSIYVVVKPSQNGTTMPYVLNVGFSGGVHICTPAIGQDTMNVTTATTTGTNIALTVTETPMFITPASVPAGGGKESVDVNTTVESASPQSTVVVYPNPTTGNVNLSIDNERQSDIDIAIIDQGGRTCKSYQFSKTPGKSTQSMDISNLANGLYFMEVVQGSERITKKIIKINR